jgi:hypothetical protein
MPDRIVLLHDPLYEASGNIGTEAEFLDENQTNVFRVFLLAIQSHL